MRAARLPLVVAALLAGGAMLAGPSGARPVRYDLPAETIPEDLAGTDGEIVVNACAACHSLEYIVTQPRGKGAQFWKDTVAKMVHVYKAPIEPADADAVAAALARKFG